MQTYSFSLHYKRKHKKVWEYIPIPGHHWGNSYPGGGWCRWQLSEWELSQVKVVRVSVVRVTVIQVAVVCVAVVRVAVILGGNCSG